MNKPIRYPLTVFYDASCLICASEMHALRDRDTRGRLELVDCSAPDFSDEGHIAEGITRAALMERLHVRDACGRWLAGTDAVAAVYRAVGLERSADLWGYRPLRPLFDRLYPLIAHHRQALSRRFLRF
jgi:predicted DCC family thiol-disulfide oxidoreductase YuxK